MMDKILSESELRSLLGRKSGLTAADAFRVAEHYYACADYQNAFQWYRTACEKPSPPPNALFNLGYAYQHGEGTQSDLSEALRWYQKAAGRDVPQAYYNLAYFYENGLFVQQDEQKAGDCIRRAAELMERLSESNYELSEQSRTLDGRVRAAQALLEECTRERDTLNADKNRLEVDLRSARSESGRLSKELHTETEQRRKAEERCLVLTGELRTARDKCSQFEHKCGSMEETKKTLQENYGKLQESYSSLSQDSRKLKEQQQAIQEELTKLTEQLKQSETNLAKAQDEAKRCRQELESANRKLQDRENANRTLHAANMQLLGRRPFLKKRTVLIGLSLISCLASFSIIYVFWLFTGWVRGEGPSVDLLLLAGAVALTTVIGIVFAAKGRQIGYTIMNLAGAGLFLIMYLLPHILDEYVGFWISASPYIFVVLAVPAWILFLAAAALSLKKEEL